MRVFFIRDMRDTWDEVTEVKMDFCFRTIHDLNYSLHISGESQNVGTVSLVAKHVLLRR